MFLKSKLKNWFLLILLIFLFFLPSTKIFAENQIDTNRLDSLINETRRIEEKIKSLQNLIFQLQLQKTISAEAYLVVNLNNQSILLEKNKEKLYPIASITKLMSAVVAKENIDLNQTIKLTEEMLKPEGYSPSLFSGLIISAKNLLQASLIQSTNDAANALTYFLEKEKFLELMNKKAKELSMTNTLFVDAHGLNPKNRSTAEDLVKLLNYLYQFHQEILSITKNNNFWLPNSTGRWLKFKNVNNFYKMPEFIGGKTGYLPETKQTLAAIFNINNQPIAIVLLSSSNRQKDALEIINWLKNQN